MTHTRKLTLAGAAILIAGVAALLLDPPGDRASLGLFAGTVGCALGLSVLLAAGIRARTAPPASPIDELFSPYRSPGFLVEPRDEERDDGALPSTLGLCAATALLAGTFTLCVAGPPLLGVFCLVAGALLTISARRAS